MRNRKSKTKSKTGGLLIGAVTGIALCIGVVLLSSRLLLSEMIGEEYTDWMIVVGLLVSSLVGNLISLTIYGKKIPAVPMITIGMILAMSICGLFLDGQFNNVLMRVVPVLLGGVLSFMFFLKKTEARRKRKKRYC